jgi:hypothetical protein
MTNPIATTHSERRWLPPLARCVLLGFGSTPEAKCPIRGRSWLRTRTLDEVLSYNGNIGCRTGDVDSDRVPLGVVDFDAKAGGLDALAAWEAEHGRILDWRVGTGSGGLHIYMRGVVGQRSCRLPVLALLGRSR